jgi:hypothetical protein
VLQALGSICSTTKEKKKKETRSSHKLITGKASGVQ